MSAHPPLLAADDPRLDASDELAVARAIVEGTTDPELDAIRRDLLAFVDAHPDALHRSCLEGHLTGSALVVDARAERALFMLHTKLRLWLQPGGHADGDANLAGVALREATEETGVDGLRIDPEPVDLDIHRVEPPREQPHLHHDVRYLVVAPPDAREQGNHESQALRWVTEDELPALGVDPGTLRLVRRGLARARARLADG